MKAWGGFCDGKLVWFDADIGWGGWGKNKQPMPAIFKTRREARERFEDVRRVEIILLAAAQRG